MSFPSYAETRTALLANETSCERLVSSFLERIERRDAELNLFCSVDADGALSRARELDAERARGVLRPLTGLVLGVKDVIATRTGETTCASRILQGFESLYDATAVRKLLEAGAIIIGKLNCDEFAMGSSNENSAFGPARNPHHLDYVPGGSSGGSAAAVAAGFCHAALGTDTGGSIRQPAAFCGVVGLKPTYGRVSRLGLVAYASSFDCMGPLALTADDVALLLGVMAGHDPWDSTSSPEPVPDYTRSLDEDIAGMRIGLPSEYFADGLDPHIRAEIGRTTDRLAARGAEIIEISLPHTAYGIATYYVLVTAEASSNLARYDGVRYGYRSDLAAVRSAMHEAREQLAASVQEAEAAGDLEAAGTLQAELDEQESLLDGFYSQTRAEGFGPEVKRRILLGTYVLSAGYYDAYYLKAQKVRTLIRRDFEHAFVQADVLLTPATPTTAFPLGSKLADPMEMYLSDIYTVTANLAGIPGLVVPLAPHPATPHLPIGLQLLGPHFAEERLLRLGKWIMAGTAAKNG